MHSQMAEAKTFTPMPGAFNPHHDYRAGRKSDIFQPPRTPSVSSSLHLSRSTASLISDQSERSTATSRKRTRHDYSVDSKATPTTRPTNWTARLDSDDLMARSGSIDPGSPMPFVNTRYQLAGGLDTPTAAAAARYGEDSEFSDVEYRRSFPDSETKRSHLDETSMSYFPRLDEPAESIEAPRIPTLSQQSSSGLSLAFEVVGTVVGKVWEFCRAGAFRGFTAGGGTKYKIDDGTAHPMTESDFWKDANSLIDVGDIHTQRECTPLPGQFPGDYIEDYMDRQTPEPTPPPASKRRQLAYGDGLARNWVVIPNPDATTPSTSTTPRSNTRPSSARYTMGTAASNNRRNTNGMAARPTSRPVARRSLHPAGSRASAVSHAGSPALRSNRPASFASPRSPAGSGSKIPASASSKIFNPASRPGTAMGTGSNNASPAAIEAQKWAERKRKEEQEADESIRRFNAQLKAMIREGKEALGSKVEVEGELDLSDGEEGDFDVVGKREW